MTQNNPKMIYMLSTYQLSNLSAIKLLASLRPLVGAPRVLPGPTMPDWAWPMIGNERAFLGKPYFLDHVIFKIPSPFSRKLLEGYTPPMVGLFLSRYRFIPY